MTKAPARRWSAGWISSLPPTKRSEILAALSPDEIALLTDDWRFWAREPQLPPPGDWRIWLFLGGRGAGKTRSGAEWIGDGVRSGRMRRIGLVGATHADTRGVMVEGESGLLAVAGEARFEPANNRLLWPGGAAATLLSAAEPDSFRGHQFDAVWFDEFCKARDPQAALDMALMGLRLGDDPRMLITTTPRNILALTALMASPHVAVTRSGTAENAANLADGFHALMQARYGGSALGRQELEGAIIADNNAALWKRGWIEARRVPAAPDMERIFVAVDPPAGTGGDACGIVVAGLADGKAYVLADCSAAGLTPAGWAARAMDAFAQHQADAVIAEANQGGEMVRTVLRQAGGDAPIRLVHAARGKITRAAPVAALYEAGRVHHVGAFPELEDQMCHYDGSGKSPDRMDALVWALSALFAMPGATPRIRKV
jgi:predicted phage terminase large subunit-like protein